MKNILKIIAEIFGICVNGYYLCSRQLQIKALSYVGKLIRGESYSVASNPNKPKERADHATHTDWENNDTDWETELTKFHNNRF